MDLSKLSDEELEAIAGGDMSKLSDETLLAITSSDQSFPEAQPERKAEASLQSFGKGLTLGYLPEIQGAAYQAGLKTARALGADIPNETLQESIDSFRGREKSLAEKHPDISIVGELAGAVTLPFPAMGAAKAATAIGRIGSAAAKGAALGGATGLLQKTGEATPQITDDPMANLKQRLENAGYGAAFGGVAGAGLTALGEGIKKAAATVGRATSGIPKSALKTYANRSGEVNKLIEAGPTAPLDVADDVSLKVKDAFFDKKAKIGQKIGQKLSESNKGIATDDLFKPLNETLDGLLKSPRAKTQAGQAEIEALSEFIKSHRTGLPDVIDARTAFELQDVFRQSGDLSKIKGTFQSRFGANSSRVEKAISDANLNAYRQTNKALEEAAQVAGVKSEYKSMIDLQKQLEKYFSDGDKTFKTLSSIEAPSKIGAKKTVQSLEKTLGRDLGIKKNAELLEAYRFFQDPELLPISSGGTTSTSRTLSLQGALEALGGVGGPKGAAFGRAVGNIAGGPMATKKIIDLSNQLSPYAGQIKAQVLRGATQMQDPRLYSPWLDVEKNR